MERRPYSGAAGTRSKPEEKRKDPFLAVCSLSYDVVKQLVLNWWCTVSIYTAFWKQWKGLYYYIMGTKRWRLYCIAEKLWLCLTCLKREIWDRVLSWVDIQSNFLIGIEASSSVLDVWIFRGMSFSLIDVFLFHLKNRVLHLFIPEG